MPKTTELRINGARRQIQADPERSLLSVLRDDLDLTGSNMDVVKASAAPVRSCWMAQPCDRVSRLCAP